MMLVPPSDAAQPQTSSRPGLPARASEAPPRPLLARARWWLFAGFGLLGLHLGQVLVGRQEAPFLWFPPAGVALALVAWLGPRAGLLVLGDALLVLLHRHLTGRVAFPGENPVAFLIGIWVAGLETATALGGWWLYHRVARGSRRLEDPRSATLFLFLVPGLAAGLGALLAALPHWWVGPDKIRWWQWMLGFWLGSAAGLLVVAPPLLITMTCWLVRRGLAIEEQPRDPQQRSHPGSGRLVRGELVELMGLALGAAILGLLQTRSPGAGDWQLWGVSFLVIVWATVRQGMRGGILVAAVGAAAPLTWLALSGRSARAEVVLQLNLLAQCCATLLIAASANWVRGSEERYRRVVGHIPVILYTARLTRPWERGRPLSAEVAFVSPVCQEVFGCTPEELLGSYERWLERVHPSDREIVLAAVAQLSRQKEPVACEYRLLDHPRALQEVVADSSCTVASSRVIMLQSSLAREYWLRDTLVPIFGADGVLEGWDGLVTDITEQRTLANDLRQTTSMFYALVANLPAGVFFVQAPSARPILVNARARQLLGQHEDSSVGLERLVEFYGLHRPDGTPYPVAELPVTIALQKGLTTMRDDIVVHQPGGKRIPLVTWAAPIHLREKGQAHGAVWVFEDLTALQQGEEARHKSEACLQAVIETMAERMR